MIEPFPASDGGIEPVEQGTEAVHPCIGPFDGIPFTIKFLIKVFVPIGIPVAFVETDVGINLLGRTYRPEILGIESCIGVQEQAVRRDIGLV